jgi:hypothetical protein
VGLLSTNTSVAGLYPVALLEGEGMGTAYEYAVKLVVLQRVAGMCGTLERVLVGGLPEKYGYDLGTTLFAAGHDSAITVVDHRPEVLDAFGKLIGHLAEIAQVVSPERIEVRRVGSLAVPVEEGDPAYDLWVSTSAMQCLDECGLASYLEQVGTYARYAVLFCPNKDNDAHLTISGLDGLRLSHLIQVCSEADLEVLEAGYLDLPPFPPGIQRSEEAKARASSSPTERLAMDVLQGWGRLERYLPRGLKHRYSHLVYVIVRPQAALAGTP